MRAGGSCLCGKVKFQITRELIDCSYCHCSICRKLTGSAFACYGGVETSGFEWVLGRELLGKFAQTSDTDRCFCSECGSYLATVYKPEPDVVYISLGALDDELDIQMEYHQFFDSRAKWCEICDELEKFREWPDET